MPFITDLISKITNFRVKIGDKLNTLKSQIGQLNLLTTSDKTSLVGAVNEVNNIQIGGRNLLRNTENKIDVSTPRNDYHLSTYALSSPLEIGKTYTISFKVKTFAGKTGQIWFRTNQELPSSYDKTINFNTENIEQVKTHTEVFTASQNDANIVFYNFGYGSSSEQRLNNAFILYDLKIERGNKATDWTPAPEDQVSNWAETNSDSLSFIKGKEIVNNEFNNIYDQISARANNRLSNLASDLTADEKGTIQDKIGVVLPTVNDGKLTLTTGTGLNGSTNFTANQSSNSIFDVSIANTHKLPSTAEFANTLKKDEENVVTENFEITNGIGTMRVGDSSAIHGEIVGQSKIYLGGDDGYAIYYTMDGTGNFSANVSGIEGNSSTSYWSLLNYDDGVSKMKMPTTGSTGRVLTTGAKIGTTTYYANTQGVIELPTVAEWEDVLKKDESNIVTENFSIERNYSNGDTFSMDVRANPSGYGEMSIGVSDDNAEGVRFLFSRDNIKMRGADGSDDSMVMDGDKITFAQYSPNKTSNDLAQMQDLDNLKQWIINNFLSLNGGTVNGDIFANKFEEN